MDLLYSPEALVNDFHHRVFTWAYRLLGRRADAEDAAQDVFLGILRKGLEVRRDGAEGYLRRITVHHCYRVLRKRRVLSLLHLDLGDAPAYQELSPEADPGRRVEAADGYARFLLALDTLPPRARTVLVLHEVEGLPSGEISQLLGISDVTVRRHLEIARGKVRKLMSR